MRGGERSLTIFQDLRYHTLTEGTYHGEAQTGWFCDRVTVSDEARKMALEIGQEGSRPVAAERAGVPLAHWKAWLQRVTAGWAVAPLVLLDGMCVSLSMLAAYLVRFHLLAYYGPLSQPFYVRLALISIPMWLGIFALYRMYSPDNLFGGLQEYASVFNGCTAGLVGLILYSFLDRGIEQDISRGWLALVWLFSVISLTWTRFGYRRLIYWLRRQGLLIRHVVIVGANEEGRLVATQLQASPVAGLRVVGFVDGEAPQGQRIEGISVLGSVAELDRIRQQLGVEEVIVIPTALSREELLDLYREWGTDDRLRIRLSSGLYELFTTGVRVKHESFVPLVSLNRTRITGMDALMKAALDYLGAIVGLILLAPAFGVIAVLVRLDSPGPAIYRRRVVGLGGKEFDAYKFRTMIADADAYLEAHTALKEEWEQTGKLRHDPRVTRVGRFLRRYSLDELPQLFNVLRGEMSLVGPRMITPEERRHFGKWQHNLLTVRPGLTGLWQISGRADLSYEERVRLDMNYIRNYTIWLDLKVLFNTFLAVVRGQGAY